MLVIKWPWLTPIIFSYNQDMRSLRLQVAYISSLTGNCQPSLTPADFKCFHLVPPLERGLLSLLKAKLQKLSRKIKRGLTSTRVKPLLRTASFASSMKEVLLLLRILMVQCIASQLNAQLKFSKLLGQTLSLRLMNVLVQVLIMNTKKKQWTEPIAGLSVVSWLISKTIKLLRSRACMVLFKEGALPTYGRRVLECLAIWALMVMVLVAHSVKKT